MLAGPSTEASPLEILEQRQLIERLQAEHSSDKVFLLLSSLLSLQVLEGP